MKSILDESVFYPVSDLQCAWLILSYCCVARANYYLRTIHPEGVEEFARTHDNAIRAVFNSLLDIRADQDTFNLASLPCRLGGVGLRNAVRGVQAAFWSSWADSLHMIRKRNPDVADFITVSLSRGRGGPHVEAAARCREGLLGVGFDVPEWDLARGARPDYDPMVDRLPGPADKGGRRRRLTQWSTNSWLGMSGLLLDPLNRLSFVPSKVPWRDFRSLACPSPWSRGFNHRSSGFCSSAAFGNLPLSSLTCRCGRPLDSRGHHVGSQQTSESRIWTSSPLHQVDNRRLEVVVEVDFSHTPEPHIAFCPFFVRSF